MKLKFFLLSLLVLIIKLDAKVTLPYNVDFENQEGFVDEDPLSNSSDWTTTDASIVTTDDVAQSGTQSVRITSASPENIISLAFDPSGNSILFVDYYMQLTASALPGLPSFTQPETTAIIAVQPHLTDSGQWVFLDGDSAGSGIWFTAGETMLLDGSDRTDWHRITLRFDLTSNLWDAYIDGNLLAVNLGFVEALIAGSEAINIYGNSTGVAYMDAFSLATTNPLFTDTDLDGIPDTFESSNGLNPAIDDRDLDPDSDGLINVEEYAYETDPSVFNADEGALNEILYNRTKWYIDTVNGNDPTGNGSQAFPLQSLSGLLAINTANPGYVGTGDTVHMAAGNYGKGSDTIAIEGLTLEGALDVNGESLTQVNNLEIIADNVTVKNLDFNSTSLELKKVSGVLVTNNLFTGSVGVSLSLLGSSNNTIDHNRFESAQYHSVMLAWDSATGTASNDNQFIRNYFTHRTSATTNESIYCTYSVGNNNSLNSRNRFIGCAFEETVNGNLARVITDEGTWWMTDTAAHLYQYSVRFEDCYFKRAARFAPFSEFVITAGWPDLTWRWDELANDTWVSSNYQYAITGDYNNWNLEPRVQFVDGDGNGLIIETRHNSGLVSSNTAPVVKNDIADIYVDQNAADATVDLYNVFEDTETADADLSFAVNISNPALVSYSLTGGTLTLSFAANSSGTSLITVTAGDDHPANPLSVSLVFTSGVKAPITDRTNWYIDAGNGDDAVGNGSQTFSLQSLSALWAINTANPGYIGTGDTVYLAAGNYGTSSDVIAINGLSLEGTLDVNGESLTQINNLEITADNVTVKNLDFNDTGLDLKNVSGTLVTNNLFTGSTDISLSLLGSSNNTISYNRFESAQYHSVMLSWDAAAGAASNDNQFIRNYFTHRTSAATNESIYCTYSAGNNNSLNARNRFIGCAFEETVSGNLTRVIADEGSWWMTDTVAHPYQYSVRFEDCYFKRADRAAAFSEFVITAGWPDLTWRWDELANDAWVSTNYQYAITGDYNDWNLEPRVQFVDSDGDGSSVETSHNAGLYLDTDGDGLDDTLEVNVYGTDPFDPDTDGDGIEDGNEISYGLNPLINDLMFDLDGDGYPNIYEVLNNSNPGDDLSIPAATQTVTADGSSEHSTLQSAINAVTSDYSIVLVKAGIYKGSKNPDFVIYSNDPAMLVISETGANDTVLDGEGVRRGGRIFNTSSAIVGFSIQNCVTSQGAGLFIAGSSSALVAKCKIYNNIASSHGGGIYSAGNNNIRIEGCDIYNNLAYRGAGIYAYNVSGLNVHNTLVRQNESSDFRGGGFYFYYVTALITHTTLYNNNVSTEVGKEIHVVGGVPTDVQLTNSIIWNDRVGDLLSGTDISADHSIIGDVSGYVGDSTVSNSDPLLTPQGLLTAGSVGIATDQGVYAGLDFDIHGEARPEGSGYDIGADEFVDSDADYLPDWLESLGVNDPYGDEDGDLLSNLYEYENGLDALNPDLDADGLNDGEELNLYATDPFNRDTDGDNMFDGEEITNGLNPLVNDAMDDLDGDGYPNIYEVRNNTDTQNIDPLLPDIPTPTLIVDVNGSSLYPSIQSGINALNPSFSQHPLKAHRIWILR